jgi:diguanylate cyclase (GGDEF)-like protein
MPLASHAGRQGVVYFYRKDRDHFLPDEIQTLNTFAHLAASAIESARLRDQLQDLAITDKLTGLRNRRLFDERLAEEILRATRYGKQLSLLLLDIDDFKRINDTRGHAAGDRVLQSLGRSLPGQLRQIDLAARYGGEEFAIVLPETDAIGAKLVGERIRRMVADTPVSLADGGEINLTVSVGVACFPLGGDCAESLVEHADKALYAAKRAGKNRVRLYSEIPEA